MIKIKLSSAFALLLVLASFDAQTQAPKSAAKPPKPARSPYYLDAQQLDLSPILPPPPAQNSAATQAELAEIHSIEKTRTPAQVAAAESDDHDRRHLHLRLRTRPLLHTRIAPHHRRPIHSRSQRRQHPERPAQSSLRPPPSLQFRLHASPNL